MTIKFCKDCSTALIGSKACYRPEGYLRTRCAACFGLYKNKSNREFRKKNRSWQRISNLKHQAKISLEDYNKILEFQNGVCAVCKKKCITGKNLSVDHNHKTGLIRGLLCSKCNKALGLLHESEELVLNLIDYMKYYEWSKTA